MPPKPSSTDSPPPRTSPPAQPPAPSLPAALARLAPTQLWPLAIALLGTLAVALTSDPVGRFPALPAGPGLTVDEGFNAELGTLMAGSLLDGRLSDYAHLTGALPDHPPLGRLWIGLWHELLLPIAPLNRPDQHYSIPVARWGSAIAFGLILFLLARTAADWFGHAAGLFTPLACLLTPRTFGHAHLAALETTTSLACLASVLYVAHRWTSDRPPSARSASLAGFLWGLALLTKIQAVLLVPPLVLWSLLIWRLKSLRTLSIFFLAGAATFFLGWPWIWSAPLTNLARYFGHAAERQTVYVWFLGQSVADREIPWYYPALLFAITIPLLFQLLALVGLIQLRPASPLTSPARARLSLVVLTVGSGLATFSVPGIAVYDGERLFQYLYPLWAMLIGVGAAHVLALLSPRLPPRAALPLLLALVCGPPLVSLWLIAPCWLSHYNLAVGGLAGANRLGLQTTYWGDSLTRELLAQAPSPLPLRPTGPIRGPSVESVQVLPVLHQFQLAELNRQLPPDLARRIRFVPYSEQSAPRLPVLLFARKEYLPEPYRSRLDALPVRAALVRHGVRLALLLDHPPPADPP